MWEDFQFLSFIRLIKETPKAYLLQITLDYAVWIPKSQTCKINEKMGTAKLANTFTIGGENEEFFVKIKDL